MAEEVYYSKGDISITNARAILGRKTYAMANITSVSMIKKPPNRALGIIIALASIIFASCGAIGDTTYLLVLGILGIIAGVAIAALLKATYIVRVGSASGESDALRSHDQEYISQIVTAVNEAIVKRG